MSVTLTLSLPAHVGELLETDGAARKRLEDMAAAMFAQSDQPPLTPELIESLKISFAQSDAGDVIDGDVFMAELFEGVGLPAPALFNEHRPKKKAA
jgi:hypothetical protein